MTTPLRDQSLGSEWTILELLARGIVDDPEREMVRDLLLADSLDWGELLEQALRHHMVPMLAHHIVSAGLRFDLPMSIYQHLESALEWNRWQIEVFRREAVHVAQGLAGRGIHFVVTKGMAFESTLYGGLGTRHMKDIDFMIAPRDREAVLSVMQKLGFRPFFDWAKDPRREEISSRLNPDHLPKLARAVDEPGTRTIMIDVANSLTWTKSPFDVPVEEALKDTVEQPVPGMPGVGLPCFRPMYQFLFTVLHLFREAWLQKFVDFGNDVSLMKFADVIRLIDRNRDALSDGELLRTMEVHNVIHAVAWVLGQLDETFPTHTLQMLALEKHGDEALLASQMQSSGYVRASGQSMRERLQSKVRGSSRPVAPAHSDSHDE
ncbi:MAG: nucleotidyltransferase family protein [Chthoniobacterales bacterium]